MKNKGFTLVELLGVIIILGIIAMIVTPKIGSSLKKEKKELCKIQYENILAAARVYGADHLLEINSGDIITLKDLQDGGYIEKNLKNPQKSDETISDGLQIVVFKNGKKLDYKYKLAISCLGNESLVEIVNVCRGSETLTNGVGREADENNPFVLGSEYKCNPGDGTKRTFYVLAERDEDVLLIMDRNLDGGDTAWNATGSNASIADANDKLRSLTSGWSLVTVNLPTGAQIASATGDSDWNDSTYTGNVIPDWLYINLPDIGYWTETASTNNTTNAWRVNSTGSLESVLVNNSNGIRPVIVVPKNGFDFED